MSSLPICKFKYTGATPGANSNTHTLFSTAVAYPGKRGFGASGIETFVLNLKHSHLGTLKVYKSVDRGANWLQISEEAIATPASTASTHRAYDVAVFDDWKIDWVNGGTAQSPWAVDMAGSADA